MLFCEKCNFITEENICPSCGNKKLRAVSDNDFRYYVSLSDFHYEMLEFTLKDNEVDVVGVPYYPYGVSRANAGRAGARKVYIRYKDFEKANEIYETIFGENE